MRTFLICATLSFLTSGCGSSIAANTDIDVPTVVDDPVIEGVKTPASQVLGIDFSRAYGASADTVTITLDGQDIVFAADRFRSTSGVVDIEAFSDALQDSGSLPDFVSYRMATPTGDTSAELTVRVNAINIWRRPRILDAAFGSEYARLNDTTIPPSGSVIMHGSYVGALTHDRFLTRINSTDHTDLIVYGDVELVASFDDASISGQITNRRIMEQSLPSIETTVVEDLLLTSTGIASDGSFSGATSGGRYRSDPTNTPVGTFTGLISGSDATEAAGMINVHHGGAPFTAPELGVFVVE